MELCWIPRASGPGESTVRPAEGALCRTSVAAQHTDRARPRRQKTPRPAISSFGWSGRGIPDGVCPDVTRTGELQVLGRGRHRLRSYRFLSKNIPHGNRIPRHEHAPCHALSGTRLAGAKFRTARRRALAPDRPARRIGWNLKGFRGLPRVPRSWYRSCSTNMLRDESIFASLTAARFQNRLPVQGEACAHAAT